MRTTDIAIVGGGLAGSIVAATLGRAGVSAMLIDPHPVYPVDFRCEKLGGDQLAILHKTGLAEAALRAATHDGSVWIARYGRLVDHKPSDQHGIRYEALVNAMRAEIPGSVPLLHAKATAIATSESYQRVTLSDGIEISARLLVLANGLNKGLRRTLGIEHRMLSECHSVTIGFDLAPIGRPHFPFPALTYYPERASHRMAYLTLFPIGEAMRANLMVYRKLDDPWLQRLRLAPEDSLHRLMPRLRHLTGDFTVAGDLKIRPTDLYAVEGHRQAGLVLIGDAFATSCPAAGTGTDKVFTDAERLCNVHIPNWLATPGMGRDKIAAYYDDPVKAACDDRAREKAFHLRALSTDNGLTWQARRWARFVVRSAQGLGRRVTARKPQAKARKRTA
jgi:2-polyprenyl-6-methoxyphenol hydroxylase-like FAD-dependent oxidoreductase